MKDNIELEEQKRIQKYQKDEMPTLIQKTLPYIKPDLEEDWKEFFAVNSDSLVGISVTRMVVNMILSIATGVSYDEMYQTVMRGSSGFAMGWAVNMVNKYTIFGDGIRKWWNKQWGVSEEETRVVNPAIINVSDESTNGSSTGSKKM